MSDSSGSVGFKICDLDLACGPALHHVGEMSGAGLVYGPDQDHEFHPHPPPLHLHARSSTSSTAWDQPKQEPWAVHPSGTGFSMCHSLGPSLSKHCGKHTSQALCVGWSSVAKGAAPGARWQGSMGWMHPTGHMFDALALNELAMRKVQRATSGTEMLLALLRQQSKLPSHSTL